MLGRLVSPTNARLSWRLLLASDASVSPEVALVPFPKGNCSVCIAQIKGGRYTGVGKCRCTVVHMETNTIIDNQMRINCFANS